MSTTAQCQDRKKGRGEGVLKRTQTRCGEVQLECKAKQKQITISRWETDQVDKGMR